MKKFLLPLAASILGAQSARAFIVGFALISAAFVTGPVRANTVTLTEGGVAQGTLSDGGVPVTFLGYLSPLTLDTIAPLTSSTATVNPANEGTLTPIANTWFGTTFAVADDHRTNQGGDLVVFDISTTFFSLTIGQQQTAFFQNQSGGTLHLTYTSFPGEGAGLSHYDQFGGPSAVPGPLAGAGLPGLVAACGGLIALARRRRKRLVA